MPLPTARRHDARVQQIIRRLGATLLVVALTTALAPSASAHPPLTGERDFPGADAPFHTYPEMVRHIKERAQAFPGIVRLSVIGKSYQGRDLWAAKISDNVAIDEDEPEVLFDGLLHAREHMSLEMTLKILDWLTDGYVAVGADGDRIRRLVDTREVWILFALNPDGAEYDIAGPASAPYRGWRKNRQPNSDGSIGTDLNRNHGYRWDCCGGSSDDPAASKYHGATAYSAPESRAFRDFVNSRVRNGRQQIRTSISFHTSGHLVMWQYGYTKTDVPSDMTRDDHAALVAMGTHMASTTSLPDGTVYKPQQGSDLYITDGSSTMWLYGVHRVLAFTFELTSGAYAPASTIESETGRNREAVMYLLEQADCPWRAGGSTAAVQDCGPMYDDLETSRGWIVNAAGTDTATGGRWERGDPQLTGTSTAVVQPGTTTSGTQALVTGRLANGSRSANDLDSGTTTIRSRPFTIPSPGSYSIRFQHAFAHDTLASADDYLSVRVLRSATATSPASSEEIRVVTGAPGVARAGTWRLKALIRSFQAGDTLTLEFVARDGGQNNVVEAAVDDIRVFRLETQPAGASDAGARRPGVV